MTDWSTFTLEELEQKFGPKTFKRTRGRRQGKSGPGPIDKGWAAYQQWRQEPDLEKKYGALGKPIPAVEKVQDALKWAWNPTGRTEPATSPRARHLAAKKDREVGRKLYQKMKTGNIDEQKVINNLSRINVPQAHADDHGRSLDESKAILGKGLETTIEPSPNSPADQKSHRTKIDQNKDEQKRRETGDTKKWKNMSNAEKVGAGSKAALDISKALFGDQTKIKTHSIQNRFLDHDWMLGSGYVG